jgi:uncharacterized protein (DUF305 family)
VTLRSYRPKSTAYPVLLAVALAACGTAARQSAEPGASSSPRYVEADVRFMQGMIGHHVQALVMTDLVADRTESEDFRRLARRIDVSQKDEIARMMRWLEARGEPVPDGHAHGALMPGMLTDEELARLGGSTGAEFQQVFLEFMIRHHEGALVMVADLFSTEGAGQEAELFQFASHVDSDQRAEIARMRGMLSTSPQGGTE